MTLLESRRRRGKAALAAGYLAFALATVVAYHSPAEAYELSIYADTPLVFWVGASFAMLAGLWVGLRADGSLRPVALVLTGLTTLGFAGLPIVRGYHFYGAGDALTHLGWAREIATGRLEAASLLYPAVHTVGVVLHDVTGFPLDRTLLLTVLAFVAVFLLFVPLCARTIDADGLTTAIAAFAALLLLLINGISLFNQPHPATQAALFLPFPLYLAVKHLGYPTDSGLPSTGAAYSILFALSLVGIVLVHPQQATNVFLLLAAFVFVRALTRMVRSQGIIVDHRSLLGHTSLLGLLLLVWIPTHERASGSLRYLVRELLFGPSPVGGTIKQRAGGLAQLGTSIEIVFVKIFLVTFVFCVIAALLMGTGVLNLVSDPPVNAFSTYAAVAMLPLTAVFAVYLSTSYGEYHFRQLGFMMVLVTVVGALGIGRFAAFVDARTGGNTALTSTLGVFFVAALVLSSVSLYHSPYMYKSSAHVTEGHMTGYDYAFEHRGDVTVTGLRAPGERYADGLYGVREKDPRSYLGESIYASTPLVGENFTASGLRGYYGSERLLPITSASKQRETEVFEGLRFPERGFRTLNSRPGVDRVQSGGGVNTYLIHGTNSSAA